MKTIKFYSFNRVKILESQFFKESIKDFTRHLKSSCLFECLDL